VPVSRLRKTQNEPNSAAPRDIDHVVKRSQGGSDFDLDRLVALCRACHDQTDAPLAAGRLIVTPLGDGRFAFDVVHGPAKYRWPALRGVTLQSLSTVADAEAMPSQLRRVIGR